MNSDKASTRCLLTLALFLTATGLFFMSGGLTVRAGQEQGKLVEEQRFENQPAQVIEVKSRGKAVKPGKRFDGDDEWLKGACWTVKNTSSKPITYMAVSLDFPETRATGNVMAFTLRYGQNPRSPALSGEPIRLMPGETLAVALSDAGYDDLQRFLERRHPVKSLRATSLRIFEVRFEDGTVWSGGSFFRPDPGNPGKLIPAEESPSARLTKRPRTLRAGLSRDTASGGQVAFTTLGYAKSAEVFF